MYEAVSPEHKVRDYIGRLLCPVKPYLHPQGEKRPKYMAETTLIKTTNILIYNKKINLSILRQKVLNFIFIKGPKKLCLTAVFPDFG